MDIIQHRPNRSECPFLCKFCSDIQRKTCDEIDEQLEKKGSL